MSVLLFRKSLSKLSRAIIKAYSGSLLTFQPTIYSDSSATTPGVVDGVLGIGNVPDRVGALTLTQATSASKPLWRRDPLCAWYDATATTNFPKGCNSNSLSDANDGSVKYAGDGYSNCGKTGSGLPFAKTTHNGQNCGVADLNGNMWEVSPGITCIAGTVAITGVTLANPLVLTAVGHGLATGSLVQVTSVGGTTQINDKIYTMTVVDANHVSLDGVDGTAFSAYTSGGTLTYGTFYALNTSYAAKDLTGGNTLATDQWGATGVAAHSSAIVPTFRTDYPQNGFLKRFGRGANAVLNSATSGDGWLLTGLGMPLASGISDGASGSNLFGADHMYQYFRDELCLISGAGWYSGSVAGAWAVSWASARSFSVDNTGFRAASYLPSFTAAVWANLGDPTDTGGVGICPEVPAGYTPLTGHNEKFSDNYGNYRYSDGSIMVWIACHYYKIDGNTMTLRPYSYYPDLATAQADGYTIHRMFYDAGLLQPGVFVDKYECSNNGGIASSIKGGNALSINAAHNPLSGLTGLTVADNNHGGVFKAAKTRGADFFPATRFIYAGLALMATAHGQMVATVSAEHGGYKAVFDDTDDNLTFSAIPFGMADDHILMIPAQPTAAGRLYSAGNTASATPQISIGITASGYLDAVWKDDAGTTAQITGSTDIRGQKHVFEMRKSGNAKSLWMDGVQIGATDNTAMGTTTLNVAKIGCLASTADTDFLGGGVYGVAPLKGQPSVSELNTVRRYLATLIGVSL